MEVASTRRRASKSVSRSRCTACGDCKIPCQRACCWVANTEIGAEGSRGRAEEMQRNFHQPSSRDCTGGGSGVRQCRTSVRPTPREHCFGLEETGPLIDVVKVQGLKAQPCVAPNPMIFRYSEQWRNFGILWVFIGVNILGAFFFYWLARVPKDKKPKEKKT
ncbi:hypothetical protein C8J57DRAFT_1216146 [Mycena rebaudengoi]|nr:hypothetical protein C8J57DRAFT_1216146 [Mycena rebaudengoi]